MGGRGGTPKSPGAFFTHLFKLHLRTSSCRHRDCAGLPSGSLRLGLYTTVGHGRRPHAWGWCQGQGAFLRTTRSRVFTPTTGFVPCVACSSGSRSASCGGTSPIKARVICWTMAPQLTPAPTCPLTQTHLVIFEHNFENRCIFTHGF